ncbi:MAG TPA: hypothetical protein VG871_15095 [Vicinamibacterales bacterium]|nr:hypothetical protein [Vicinamibacterales bacterium]
MLSRISLVAAAALTFASVAGPSAQSAIPRTSDGHPNLQGIWQVKTAASDDVARLVEGGSIPYLPAAAAERAKNAASRGAADPLSKCYMPGVPRIMYMEWPFQILQEPNHVAMLFAWMLDYRLIYTNGSPHETRLTPWMGDSRGRWDGDTLVIDVTQENEQTWFDKAGDFHSDALHVVERYTMLDADTIRYQATMDDPKVFARPWKIDASLSRQKGMDRVPEFHCQAEKEEANGDFEREPRTWYPGPNAVPATFLFQPPAEQPRPSKAPASVRRTADGKPDLNGLYEADGGGANYGLEAHPPSAGALTPPGRGVIVDPPDGKLPFQPWARQERLDRTTPIRGYDDPTAHCFPAGVPRALYVPTPFHIVQTRDAVATLHERMQWRLISLNRSAHLPDTTRLWQGDSIGHWDGDTLVVDTANFNGRTWGSELGDVFSYAEHVTERFIPVDANTIRYEATISDPVVYTRPFTIAIPLKRIPGELFEAACHEEDHDLPVLKRIRDQERAKLKK